MELAYIDFFELDRFLSHNDISETDISLYMSAAEGLLIDHWPFYCVNLYR